MVCVSIIIPVYNGEQYLEQCLNSALNQSLKEIEIICVDDGSTDSSRDIMEKYRCRDVRIKVLYQTNQGAGAARNYALKEAQGEFVVFLDADDYYIDSDALEKMYRACKEYGVSICGSLRKSLHGNKEVEEAVFDDENKWVKSDCIYQYEDVQCDYNYQSYLFKRQLLVKNAITFPKYRRFEDPVFLAKAMYAAEKFYFAGTYLYCYRISDVVQRFDLEKTIDLLSGIRDNLVFSSENNLDILFQRTLERLEYEYTGIIYRNICGQDVKFLSMLLQLNELVRNHMKDGTYVLEPLKRMLDIVSRDSRQYERCLTDKIRNSDGICLYGAGKLANVFFDYLVEQGLEKKVHKILVSRKSSKDEFIRGIPIVGIDEYDFCDNEIIFVTVRLQLQKEIVLQMKKAHIDNYEILDTVFLRNLEAVNRGK